MSFIQANLYQLVSFTDLGKIEHIKFNLVFVGCTNLHLAVTVFETDIKVVVAYWKVKTPCHAHGECIN